MMKLFIAGADRPHTSLHRQRKTSRPPRSEGLGRRVSGHGFGVHCTRESLPHRGTASGGLPDVHVWPRRCKNVGLPERRAARIRVHDVRKEEEHFGCRGHAEVNIRGVALAVPGARSQITLGATEQR